MRDGDLTAAEFEALVGGAAFVRELDRLAAAGERPYPRLDRPSHLTFTSEQWQLWDSWDAYLAERDRKYGRLMPRALSTMRAAGSRIW